MKLKKVSQVVVEVLVDESDAVSYVLRATNGAPIEICSTPLELTALFSELSKVETPKE